MDIIVYGDFNCPYSYLASQRVDTLLSAGVRGIEWRAVEHVSALSRAGTPSAEHLPSWATERAELAGLALPGETVPDTPPPLVSNTEAATSAYAEAVTDGVEHQLRRRLFEAIWVHQRHISDPSEVRRLVAEVTWPSSPIEPYLVSDLPLPGTGDPDPIARSRREGATITAQGAPLTTPAWHRQWQWRMSWLTLPQQRVPAVVRPDGTVAVGAACLTYLASLLPAGEHTTDTVPADTVPADTVPADTAQLAGDR